MVALWIPVDASWKTDDVFPRLDQRESLAWDMTQTIVVAVALLQQLPYVMWSLLPSSVPYTKVAHYLWPAGAVTRFAFPHVPNLAKYRVGSNLVPPKVVPQSQNRVHRAPLLVDNRVDRLAVGWRATKRAKMRRTRD